MGRSLVVTKRGKPVVQVVRLQMAETEGGRLFRTLVGFITIVGDPDDLIKPVFSREDYDMLKMILLDTHIVVG